MHFQVFLRPLALASTLLLVGACATVASSPRPRPVSGSAVASAEGFFATDEQTLSDEAIARILDTRWEAQDQVRIALLPLSQESVEWRYGYGMPSAAAGMQTALQAVEELRRLPNVYDVSYLPEFLLAGGRSLPLVREAAARYQADWVLLYSTNTSTHTESWLFASDEVKGLCIADCALLDTRTGLIPFTARSTQGIDVESSKDDAPSLRLRAEFEAVDAAMLENARALVAFLEASR